MKKLLILGTSIIFFSASYAGLYKWVDENGEVHFSDKVPVAVSQKAHQKIDKRGITRKTIDPQAVLKSKEREQQLEIESINKERIALKKQKILEKTQKRDQYLLSTYDNEKEISFYFESKIKLLKGNSSFLLAQNNVLTKKVEKLKSKANINKDKATKESLEKRIIDINQTIEQYDKALLDNDNELFKLSKTYKTDYKRYTELTQ